MLMHACIGSVSSRARQSVKNETLGTGTRGTLYAPNLFLSQRVNSPTGRTYTVAF